MFGNIWVDTPKNAKTAQLGVNRHGRLVADFLGFLWLRG